MCFIFFHYRYEYRSHQIWFPVRVLGDWCLVFITHMHTCTHCTWWLTGVCWEGEATTLDTVPSHATCNTEQYIVLGTTLLVWKGIVLYFYWLRWSLLENIPTTSLPCYEMEICHTMVCFCGVFHPGWCVVWLFRLVVSCLILLTQGRADISSALRLIVFHSCRMYLHWNVSAIYRTLKCLLIYKLLIFVWLWNLL